MTRVNFLLELTEVRNKWKKELEIGICQIFNIKYFFKELTPSALLTVTVRVSIKSSAIKFTTAPTWDWNRDFPSEGLVKVSAQESIKLSFELGVNENSSSGLKQRLPNWNFIESSSLRFDFLPPMPGFAYSSNSGLEQKRPKWNLTESSAWSSTTFKVKLCWKWDLIYPVWGFNQTILKLSLAATPTRDRTMSSQVKL